jgi:hypothetical protein
MVSVKVALYSTKITISSIFWIDWKLEVINNGGKDIFEQKYI